MISSADAYFKIGCMRCKYGNTPQCKVNAWKKELEMLRNIVLKSGLIEEIKWGVPVYTHMNKNVVSVNALKDSANLSFFKGALMEDAHSVLEQQGNIQAGRLIRFTSPEQVLKLRDIIKEYIEEAIQLEENGRKIVFRKNPEPIPEELATFFTEDPDFEAAFYKLTPGRQRGYILHFSQPKQSETRIKRILKLKSQIFSGLGINGK